MRTLIIGDSLVGRVSGPKYQLRGGGHVMWSGEGGLKLGGLLDRLSRFLKSQRRPSTFIIHVGTNDLFDKNSTTTDTRAKVEEVLSSLRRLCPDSRIIWSDILPRAFYWKANKQSAGKKCVSNINRFAHSICTKSPNMHFIRHSLVLNEKDHSLYMYDCVHLSPAGKQILLDNWANALVFFNSYPSEVGLTAL